MRAKKASFQQEKVKYSKSQQAHQHSANDIRTWHLRPENVIHNVSTTFFVVSAVRYEIDLRQRLHLTLPQLSYNLHTGENKLLFINIIVMEWMKRCVLRALFVMFALHSLKVYFARNKNATVRFNFIERKTHIQWYHSI